MAKNTVESGSFGVNVDLVDQLVLRIKGNRDPHSTQKCIQILSSRYGSSLKTDALTYSERINKQLMRRRDSKVQTEQMQRALRFQEKYRELLKNSFLKNQGSILCFFSSVMDLASLRPSAPFAHSIRQRFGSVLKVQDEPSSVKKPASRHSVKPPASTFADVEKTAFDAENAVPSRQNEMNSPSLATKEAMKRELLGDDVCEQVLLRDVLFCFQGISSKYIFFNPKRNSFEISKDVGIPMPRRHLLQKLCEMGWLYNRVVKYTEVMSAEPSAGLVCQSFVYALQLELADYYRLIAILESQIDQDADFDRSTGTSSSPLCTDLTLRRMDVWVQTPFERMRFMACLVDSVHGLRGGALASGVYRFHSHGDPCIKSFTNGMTTKLAGPIFAMIRRWVFEGELDDHQNEFFVVMNHNVPDDQLWKQKYKLNEEMIPTFVSKELANRILTIGKSINFIRRCCEDSEWVLKSVAPAVEEAEKLDFADLDKLESIIADASDVTNAHLTSLLLTKHNLLDHCRAIKLYLLLGQGDFVQYLMDLLGPELSKAATQIYRHNLNSVLETALNSSNAKYETADILNRLDVKLYQPSPGDDGWDVFSLHYKVPTPLNAIMNEQSMNEYLQIFNLLWRLKRVEYSLSQSWCRDMNLVHMMKNEVPDIAHAVHKSHLLRCEMVHFVTNLHNYMMFEVLEISWHKLVEDMKAAKDFDSLIESHNLYLNNIKKNALLLEESKPLLNELKNLFQTIIRFCKVQELLFTEGSQRYSRRKMQEQSIERNTAEGRWGMTETPDAQLLEDEMMRTSRTLLLQMKDISHTYTSQFLGLLETLQSQGIGTENLRFLTFRLDFNEFYKRLEIIHMK